MRFVLIILYAKYIPTVESTIQSVCNIQPVLLFSVTELFRKMSHALIFTLFGEEQFKSLS